MEWLLETMREMDASSEFFLLSASLIMKLYQALLDAGFDKEQAMKIVVGRNLSITKY